MRKKIMAVVLVLAMLGVSLTGCGKDAKETGDTVESSSSDSGSTEGNYTDTTVEADVSDDALYVITWDDLLEEDVYPFLMECVEAEIVLVAMYLEDPDFGDLNAALTMSNMLFLDEDAPDSWLKVADNYKVRDCLSHYFDGEFETYEQQGQQIISDEMAELAGLPSGANYETQTVTIYDTEYVNIHFNEGLKSVSLAFNTPKYGNQQIREFWNKGGSIRYNVSYHKLGSTNLPYTIDDTAIGFNFDTYYYYAGTSAKILRVVDFSFIINDVNTPECTLAFVFENDIENPEKWLICGVYPVKDGKVQAPDDIIETLFDAPRLVHENDTEGLLAREKELEQLAKEKQEREEMMAEAQQTVNNVSDEELKQALNAYVSWLAVAEDTWFMASDLDMYQFVYIDEDNIPELLMARSDWPDYFYMLNYFEGSVSLCEWKTPNGNSRDEWGLSLFDSGSGGGHTWYIKKENAIAGYIANRYDDPEDYYRARLENGSITNEYYIKGEPEDGFDYDRAIKINIDDFYPSISEAWDALMSVTP